MTRITITFYVLAGVAAIGAGGIATALGMPAGLAAVSLFLVSATVALVGMGLAARILHVLERRRAIRVPVRDDR